MKEIPHQQNEQMAHASQGPKAESQGDVASQGVCQDADTQAKGEPTWDINRESKTEHTSKELGEWSLLRSKRAKREKQRGLTTQGSRGFEELSKAQGLTPGAQRDQG